VCTSGGYERTTADGAGHHLLDPRTGQSADGLASLAVVAPTAMAADGLATAAFILGLDEGRRLLEQSDVAGVFITPDGAIHRASRRG
jgi:FAD:protein FMN transferase